MWNLVDWKKVKKKKGSKNKGVVFNEIVKVYSRERKTNHRSQFENLNVLVNNFQDFEGIVKETSFFRTLVSLRDSEQWLRSTYTPFYLW